MNSFPKVYHVWLDGTKVEGLDFNIIQDNVKVLYCKLSEIRPYIDVLELRLKIQKVGNTTNYFFITPPIQDISFEE